ncbi:MAG TPA: DNA sulfur modification protein DndB, partial [Caulobacteraceae bacterium]|nr:DNA sulfur modification protein DndB [Caulobacteraceae bacterium]
IESAGPDAANFKFPVTFYCPRPNDVLTIDDLGQLFADFNGRVHAVPARFSLRLEQVDRYVRLSRSLYEEPFLFEHGGVAEGAASLGGKSKELVAQTVFVRAVRGACEGRRFQDTGEHLPDNPTLTDATFDELRDSIGAFFNTIAEYMGDERWEDADSVHLTSPGWQALGVLHHDLVVRQLVADPLKTAKKLASLDWSRFNEDWLANGLGDPEVDKDTGAVVVDQKGRKRLALTNRGRTSVDIILGYAREQLGIKDVAEAASQTQ